MRDPEKDVVASNAALASAQVLVTAATLFVFYRFVLGELGAEALGVWSLVLSATSLANVTNLGLSGGTVRFVSMYLARGEKRTAERAIETAVISIAFVTATAALLLWPIFAWVLERIVSPQWIPETRALLPFVVVSLWLQSVGGTIHSGLDGCHRAGTRSIIGVITQPLLLFIGIALVPSFGIVGIAAAQVIQFFIWLVLGWIALRKNLPGLASIPRNWSRDLFLEMWRYNLTLYAISILTVLLDPIAKLLLTHFGSLSTLGYFEMANRLVIQVRSLLVGANQVLVPYYTKVSEVSRQSLTQIYEKNLLLVITIGALAFSTLATLLPAISWLWIGRHEERFLVFALILALGWFSNLVSAPAYFANLGAGFVKRNLAAHITQLVSLGFLGIIGGLLFGPIAVVGAYATALLLGCAVIIILFHREEIASHRILFSQSAIRSTLIGCLMAILSWILYRWFANSLGPIAITLAASMSLTLGWILTLLLVPQVSLLAGALCQKLCSRRPGSVFAKR